MINTMIFSKTIEEFMEQYKIVDTEHVYTNGTELVPIFRMKQWFEHSEKRGRWIDNTEAVGWPKWNCSVCGGVGRGDYKFCPWCGARMDGN